MAAPLVDAIDALEYLLTARLMPEDYDVEELADALDHGEDGDLGVEVRCVRGETQPSRRPLRQQDPRTCSRLFFRSEMYWCPSAFRKRVKVGLTLSTPQPGSVEHKVLSLLVQVCVRVPCPYFVLQAHGVLRRICSTGTTTLR